MESLHKKILEEGKALSGNVLKVDSFLNHQVDPDLMFEMGTYFKKYFENHGVTKIFTIESSGIAPSVMTAMQMNIPMVILKKQTSKILSNDFYQTTVHSFTKGHDYELTLAKKYINEADRILIIDDFLANGEAALGAIRLVEDAGAEVAGIGIVIEKSFQPGYKILKDKGYDLYSLARIAKLGDNIIEFAD
ncbi:MULTISPECIES: xanthine phosphoribosyltransferase [Clostridium]|jgi:xanthine phosphoribosyltransferase|uniref:Xanthine phosphoribosyltransferase n=1 Tax=Clostridium saccharoperbutylacetonicum N1-4(HMT) TaxID=931276 RepID=M1MKJ6_9CLOT|nr:MULTISPECIES: xanthine phosphoribosyltransferase [Clostridium]AGF56793.1 xanthine phosphoribosyltransferase Xpt [Clostridium saccharoperbutylacetonicum N1-4(HMT)]AQR95453.1 xanthine phosphoribosyltransferase [Clostridium saccharoperbutylacetonicum]NRT62450.1 xanthine phosphoribosyltransferase [Clostridium saccharoperbutylacetonicum]NSB25792.1 xanthine phosphoribosyltransferase [Clostridium saccharoperbutylacetonicum]NSB31312.1 xanthine phosphoribosyltransferase [Clostridium saccharoperbutyl